VWSVLRVLSCSWKLPRNSTFVTPSHVETTPAAPSPPRPSPLSLPLPSPPNNNNTHTPTTTHTHPNTHTRARARARMHACMHACLHTRTHTNTRTQTNTRTRAHARTHAHTHAILRTFAWFIIHATAIRDFLIGAPFYSKLQYCENDFSSIQASTHALQAPKL